MKSLTKIGLLLAFAALASISSAAPNPAPGASSNSPGVHISASIAGHLSYVEGAWVGYMLVRFGAEPVRLARFQDRNTGITPGDDGVSFSGTETITVTFVDGSGTFEIVARFDAVPTGTPAMYMLHETGSIANGTGAYTGVGGSVSVTGPFMHPDPAVNPGALLDADSPPPWLAKLHGRITGLPKTK